MLKAVFCSRFEESLHDLSAFFNAQIPFIINILFSSSYEQLIPNSDFYPYILPYYIDFYESLGLFVPISFYRIEIE